MMRERLGMLVSLAIAGTAAVLGQAGLAQRTSMPRVAQMSQTLTGPQQGAISPNLPDTGITASSCYQAGNEIYVSCSSPAAIAVNPQQDGAIGFDVSQPYSGDGRLGFRYVRVDANGNKLPLADNLNWDCVIDEITGLMWENKSASGLRWGGQTYTNYGDGRNGDASKFVTQVNVARLCGFNDWRLPSAIELQSIVDYGYPAPSSADAAARAYALDPNYFQNSKSSDYWVSDRFASNPTMYGRRIIFLDGGLNWMSKGNPGYVRLVRGVPPVPSPRYTFINSGSEVRDGRTGLTWQRCVVGQSWSGTTCTGTPSKFLHEAALNQAQTIAGSSGSPWRVPNVKELASIVDFANSPAFDANAFPATPLGTSFWTSTPRGSGNAWFINFSMGWVNSGYLYINGTGGLPNRVNGQFYLRLVR